MATICGLGSRGLSRRSSIFRVSRSDSAIRSARSITKSAARSELRSRKSLRVVCSSAAARTRRAFSSGGISIENRPLSSTLARGMAVRPFLRDHCLYHEERVNGNLIRFESASDF
ncbi:hypothetical protein AZA_55777 [Nitrospirillum viridazoti Y2]|nr:hypothetical protein AZA_55777 [Nitrospirillum amazonense Y2]